MVKKLLYLDQGRHATWLELFFDLIFVVALGKLTHLLAHTHHGHLAWSTWGNFILSFIPMWWIWVGHTVYCNRFDADTRPHRIATLFLMLLIMVASIQIGETLLDHHGPFVIVYCIARVFIAVQYFLAGHRHTDKATFAWKTGLAYSIGALLSFSSVLFELPLAVIVFYSGLLFDVLGGWFLVGQSVPIDRDHLVERVGLLAIILLGESVISISSGLTDMTWDTLTIIISLLGFVFIFMIWWMYFDSFPLLIHSDHDVNGNAILYSQLLTYVSFAILANMIRHAILNDLDVVDFRFMVFTGMVLFYLGKQIAYYVNRPEYRLYIILNTTAMLVIMGLSLLFSKPQFILCGASFSMMVYIALNYRAQIRLYGKVHL